MGRGLGRVFGGVLVGVLLIPMHLSGVSRAQSPPVDPPYDPIFTCGRETYSSPEPSWGARMPQPRSTTVSKRDVQIKSADGTLISARVYRPLAFKGRRPTILVMSPYHSFLGLYFKEFEDYKLFDYADCIALYMLQRGYVVVLADMRGTHNSDGCFDYGGPGDQADGYAMVQWIANQRWSNRRVGMYGASHVGMSQYAAAVKSPPALKAIIPVAPITSFYRYLYYNAVHYETNMLTPPAYDYGAAGPPPTDVEHANYPTNVGNSACNIENTVGGMSLAGDFTSYWRKRDYSLMANRIKAAVFHVHGTLDQNVKMDHFTSMWRALGRAKVPRKALIGPWGHQEPALDSVKLLEYWHLIALRFYEHWLQGNDTGMMREPPLMLIDNRGTVRKVDRFPPGGGRRLFLHASGGKLTTSPRKGSAVYRDVPSLPRQLLPSAEGARLIYDSARFSKTRRIVGEPVVEVVASIDRTDTNFVAHLYDLAPDGRATYISRGYLDARHRYGLTRGKDVEPGKTYRYRWQLLAHDYVVPRGHKVRLLIASSDSCPWAVEFTGLDGGQCKSSGVVSDATAAQVTVLEGAGRTTLTLPLP